MALNLHTIGELARRTGATPRAIRHYEQLGLLMAPVRTDSNYRMFDQQSIKTVEFIVSSRSLGLSIPEIAELLKIIDNEDSICMNVAQVMKQHLSLVDDKIKMLTHTRRMIAKALSQCADEDDADCSALEILREPH
jgi:DNA-binding transcriptional MerR regulator